MSRLCDTLSDPGLARCFLTSEFDDSSRDLVCAVDLALMGLIGFDVGAGSFFVRPELLRLLKRGKHRDANQDDLALAV